MRPQRFKLLTVLNVLGTVVIGNMTVWREEKKIAKKGGRGRGAGAPSSEQAHL